MKKEKKGLVKCPHYYNNILYYIIYMDDCDSMNDDNLVKVKFITSLSSSRTTAEWRIDNPTNATTAAKKAFPETDADVTNTIWIWAANLDNYNLQDGALLNGAGMAGTNGPTKGISKYYYVGIPTTLHGIKTDKEYSKLKKKILEVVYTINKRKNLKYIIIPRGKSNCSDLGRGIAVKEKQNGKYQDRIHKTLDNAIDLIKKIKNKSSRRSVSRDQSIRRSSTKSKAPMAAAGKSKCHPVSGILILLIMIAIVTLFT